jgi:hypothetical protein
MVHLSSSEHYEEVQRRLEKCDAIFFEGVKVKMVSLWGDSLWHRPKS